MRTILPIVLLIAASGCKPDFATVEEACDDKVPGDNNINDKDATAVFTRINCYRRLAKMNSARLDKQIQEAVQNHNDYQLANATEEDLDPWNGIFDEVDGQPHFTGKDPVDRLEEVGYANLDRGTILYWEWSYQDDQGPVDRIDFWFPEPHVRQSYLQPAWVGGGFAEGPTEVNPERRIAYANIFHQVPVRDHAGSPVIYPKEGQEDVPTTFEAVWTSTATFGMGKMGYPITITVGSSEHGGGANPHSIQVRKSTLIGPDGEVELFVETPESHGFLRYSAAFYPIEPLAPQSEYTLEVEMDWLFNDKRSLTTTFRTGNEFEPHGFGREVVPEPPSLRHGTLHVPSL